ncbi:hypothetical protein, partial [Cupriavidus sp. U2]|uniref:hypothetical protein n=1 Tax=Cupriavidus sp. U2 TaxID=2920269 RepID=UPI001E47D921
RSSVAFAIKRPHLSVVCLLKNPSDRLCRSLSLRLLSQRRNEIMQSIQRFVNSFCRTFFCRPAPRTSQRQPPANPATVVAAAFAARFVLRGGEY